MKIVHSEAFDYCDVCVSDQPGSVFTLSSKLAYDIRFYSMQNNQVSVATRGPVKI